MRACLFIFTILSLVANAQDKDFKKTLFEARDFTEENLFTNNIEGPNFDKAGNLYVVNFQKDGTIGKIHSDGKGELFVVLPEGSTANAIQFDKDGNMLLADFSGHNILRVDMQSHKVSVFVHNDEFNQPNDICINKKGQLFASDPNWKNSNGKIWRIDPDGKAVLLSDQMGTANGIELSPSQKILYVNESVQRTIWAFDVDDVGNVSNKREFFKFDDFGMDGMKCDKKGNLYVCRYGKGVIAVLSPDGKLVREVQLKGKRVSNIVFGGKDKKTCFVTLQDRKGLEMFRSDTAGR